MEKLILKKPVNINGELTEEIEYDLENLTGQDIQQIVRDLNKRSIVIGAVELDVNYHAALFAQAAGLSFDDISNLSVKDYNEATVRVRNFFLAD